MVKSILVSNQLVIKYVSGITTDGKDITKNQSFNNFRMTITDEDIFAVGTAIASLMENNIVDFRKNLGYTLMST